MIKECLSYLICVPNLLNKLLITSVSVLFFVFIFIILTYIKSFYLFSAQLYRYSEFQFHKKVFFNSILEIITQIFPYLISAKTFFYLFSVMEFI